VPKGVGRGGFGVPKVGVAITSSKASACRRVSAAEASACRRSGPNIAPVFGVPKVLKAKGLRRS